MSGPEASALPVDPLAGTARLRVLAVVASSTSFCLFALAYSLPLFFEKNGFGKGAWPRFVAYQAAPWCVSALLGGLLARRFGERRLWVATLLAQVLVPGVLIAYQHESIIAPLAIWAGFSNGVMWVSGMSITQMVPTYRTALANAVVLTALGVGGFAGPLVARVVLRQDEVRERWNEGWLATASVLVADSDTGVDPPRQAFGQLFTGISVLLSLSAGLMYRFGERPGRPADDGGAGSPENGEPLEIPSGISWQGAARDVLRVARQPRFFMLAVLLALFSGPLFMVSNMYLKSRAEDFQLIVKAQDRGWIWVQLASMVGQTAGGAAVGMLAGRKLPPRAAALVAASFGLSMAAMAMAAQATVFFAAVLLFEFLRPSMRWAGAGYLAEFAPHELRAIAVGLGVMLANIGMTAFGVACLQTVGFEGELLNARSPMFIAGCIGFGGAALLFMCDVFASRGRR